MRDLSPVKKRNVFRIDFRDEDNFRCGFKNFFFNNEKKDLTRSLNIREVSLKAEKESKNSV